MALHANSKAKIEKLTEDIGELEAEAQEDLSTIVPLKLERKEAKKALVKAETEVDMVNVGVECLYPSDNHRSRSQNSRATSRRRRLRLLISIRRSQPRPATRAQPWTLRWRRFARR